MRRSVGIASSSRARASTRRISSRVSARRVPVTLLTLPVMPRGAVEGRLLVARQRGQAVLVDFPQDEVELLLELVVRILGHGRGADGTAPRARDEPADAHPR